MSEESALSRELALCIGLAAKALPDTQLKDLVSILTEKFGMPLSHDKLKKLSLEDYQKLLNNHYHCSEIKQSLNLLKNGGRYQNVSAANNIKMYRKGDMPFSLRTAIASNDGIHINGQFSNCQSFYIFQISSDEYRLIAIRAADTKEKMKSEQRISYRAEILQDCQLLYCDSIGGAAASKVINQGVHPIKMNANAPIADIIEQLQTVMLTSPPPWLAKSMGVKPKHKQLQEEQLS